MLLALAPDDPSCPFVEQESLGRCPRNRKMKF